jgi:hypothetical protein
LEIRIESTVRRTVCAIYKDIDAVDEERGGKAPSSDRLNCGDYKLPGARAPRADHKRKKGCS